MTGRYCNNLFIFEKTCNGGKESQDTSGTVSYIGGVQNYTW